MLKKAKNPPIEISDKESIFTFSPPSPTSSLFRTGEKRGYPQSSPENENQKPAKKIIKLTTTIDSIPNIPLPPSREYYLQKALEGLK